MDQPPIIMPNQSLSELVAIMQTLFEASGEGFIVLDHKNLIQLASPELERMWGYNTGELAGKAVQVLMPLRYRKDHTLAYRTFFLNNKPRTSGKWFEVEALHKRGHEFPINIRIMKVPSASRFLMAAAVRDATAFHNTHELIHRMMQADQGEMQLDSLILQLNQIITGIHQMQLPDDED